MARVRHKLVEFPIPKWLAVVYGLLAAALVPWTVNLSASLPYRYLSNHWDVAWVGFDLMLLATIAATAVFALTKSRWVVLSAMATSALLAADAWLDVWTSRPGHQMNVALTIAILVELPLAAASFWLAHRAMARLVITDQAKS